MFFLFICYFFHFFISLYSKKKSQPETCVLADMGDIEGGGGWGVMTFVGVCVCGGGWSIWPEMTLLFSTNLTMKGALKMCVLGPTHPADPGIEHRYPLSSPPC